MVIEYVLPISLVLLIIYMIKHPEKVEHWSSIFARIFALFSIKAERHCVSADIQSRLSSYIKNYTVEDVLPHGIRFRWIDKGNFEAFVEEDDVVVVMDVHKNNARNFINAIVAYTSQGLLPNVRNYLPEDVLIATELIIQEKIISEKRPDALSIYKKEILPERKNSLAGIAKYHTKFEALDKNGYFESVFLPELSHTGPRLQDYDDNEGKQDIAGFISFLDYIANREPGDESKPLQFNGKIFHVWIILIAKPFKIQAEGVSPYLNRAKEAISKQFDSIYLMTRGKNIKHLKPIIEAIKENTTATLKWTKSFRTRYSQKQKQYNAIALFRV